ncbi:DoxX family protein [Candidatus Sumerlaeota bacterium]|nr:DoxX family protein [Candidatus Sumerlaeota bacterium]
MKSLFRNLFATDPSWAPLIMRLVLGVVFIAHGGQKFFDKGVDQVAQGFGSMGIPMPYTSALLASSTEFFGGILMVLGLLVRPAAIPMAFTMIVAFVKVHGSKGFFLQTGGFEYVFVLFFLIVAVGIGGAGKFSLDGLLSKKPLLS